MTQSATAVAPSRDHKRRLTAYRITVCAQELALEHGLDGFTMDDLAARAEVSRRTLFNYFPGKDDAVLGGPPVIDEALLETFAHGGPTGDLVEDLAAIVVAVLSESPDTREDVARGRRVLLAEPRLLTHARDQLQACVESCMAPMQLREGERFDRARVDMAIVLILACVHVAMDRFVDDGTDAVFADLFTESLATARALLR